MKRKACSTSMRDELRMSQISVIDRQGDLYMVLDNGRLLVSRKALCLSSSVFLAMLGEESQFSESKAKIIRSDGIQEITFRDDDFSAMQLVTNVIHLQNDKVPLNVSFQQLHQIAILCDKYDLKRCLGYWPEKWAAPWLDSYSKAGYEALLFISTTFRFPSTFKNTTKHLIRNAIVSKSVLSINGIEFGEGVSLKIMSKYSSISIMLGADDVQIKSWRPETRPFSLSVIFAGKSSASCVRAIRSAFALVGKLKPAMLSI